jgi:L,D-transpeptidase YcbB
MLCYIYRKFEMLCMTPFRLLQNIIVLLLLFSSCQKIPDGKEMSASADVVKDSLRLEKAKTFFKDELKDRLSLLLTDSLSRVKTDAEPLLFSGPALRAAYIANGFEAIWLDEQGLNASGRELLRLLQNTERYGLNSKYYGAGNIAFAVTKWKPEMSDKALAADIELSLSNAWLLLALHLNKGAVGKQQLLNHDFGSEPDMYATEMLQAVADGKVQSRLESFQPKHIHYRNLQKELAGFYNSKNVLPENFSIRDHKKDSAGAAVDVMKALFYHGYLDSASTDAVAYKDALMKFQKEHGLVADGVPGPNTNRLLLTDNKERYRRVALNIERWRSSSYAFPKEYILVNIPGFEAYVMNGDVYERTHRVIVGKPSTSTPELESTINLVVVNPDWTVPQSIIRKEMRGKSYAYLSKYNIFQGGRQVSPGQVNWSAGGIRMVQPPGPTNALGLIKFMFNNPHSVYLHDTPSRNLFENTVRAYSHGCVRMQNPLEFGAYLLQREGKNISVDSLKAMIQGGKLTNIRLTKGLPIYITYFTAMTDPSGTLQLYPDLYKKEEQNAAVLFFGRYDKSVDPLKGREAIPSINAIPDALMPEDSAMLVNIIIP